MRLGGYKTSANLLRDTNADTKKNQTSTLSWRRELRYLSTLNTDEAGESRNVWTQMIYPRRECRTLCDYSAMNEKKVWRKERNKSLGTQPEAAIPTSIFSHR